MIAEKSRCGEECLFSVAKIKGYLKKNRNQLPTFISADEMLLYNY